MPIVTPINLILFAVFVVFLYMQLRPKTPVTLPQGPPPTVYRVYTPTTLLEHNGEEGKAVYLAVRGRIFDVTPGRNFYGPVSFLGGGLSAMRADISHILTERSLLLLL